MLYVSMASVKVRVHKSQNKPEASTNASIAPLGNYCLVMQYANQGNLSNYLCEYQSTLGWPARVSIAAGIAQGLTFLHSHNIVHRDLHPGNVLMHDDKALICDFGLAKSLESESSSKKCHGIVPYRDPQLFLNPETFRHGKASDIYSFGMLLWRISRCVNALIVYDYISCKKLLNLW